MSSCRKSFAFAEELPEEESAKRHCSEAQGGAGHGGSDFGAVLTNPAGFGVRANSRFLHCAVASAPASVGMTRRGAGLRVGGLRVGRTRYRRRVERHLQDFREVEGVAGGALGDLFAAAEAVGDDEPVPRGFTDCGEKFEFADGGGNVIFLFISFEAEGASHAAASGSWGLEVDADAVQQRFFGGHLHDGFVMTVSVKERFAF